MPPEIDGYHFFQSIMNFGGRNILKNASYTRSSSFSSGSAGLAKLMFEKMSALLINQSGKNNSETILLCSRQRPADHISVQVEFQSFINVVDVRKFSAHI